MNYSKKMCSGLLVLLFAVCNGRIFAATSGNVSEAIPDARSQSETFVSAGPGLVLLNGSTGWSVNVGALHEIGTTDLFVGADLGLDFWNFNPAIGATGTFATGATAVQLLPTAIYRFHVA